MIDNEEVQTALRNHVLSTLVATTGSITLEATTTGFKRTTGSFIADKFRRGMEVLSANFPQPANNIKSVITSVSPTEMRVSPFVITIANGTQTVARPSLVADAPAPGRIITAGVPSMRALENEVPVGLTSFIPVANIPYYEEEFSPSTNRKLGFPIKQSSSEYLGEYIIKLHGVTGTGIGALRKTMDAIELKCSAGTVLVTPSGYKVLIDSDPAPATQGVTQTTTGPVLTLFVPWVVRSRNTVVA